ncbi:nuclease-related domain-containing protein [Morganella morganii]|uniref:nuclease-related domain-containing protein n=1 Tax=Morganella morganii TaxID=582 RepID=UPI0021A51FD5|nr:nuclease-related domain-containing protein [Morganella morganii]
MSNFFDWMRKQEVIKPTQMHFNLHKWKLEADEKLETSNDKKLYEATIFTYNKLNEIRDKMVGLDIKYHPKNMSYSDLLKKVIDYSNFKYFESIYNVKYGCRENKNPITSLNIDGNMTQDESCHASIDALNSAIDFIEYFKNKKTDIIANGNKKNLEFFIHNLSYWSGLYGSISSHYNAVLYEQYDFIKNDEEIIFKEKYSESIIADKECYYKSHLKFHLDKEANRYDILRERSFDIRAIFFEKNGRKNGFLLKTPCDEAKIHFYYYIYNLNKAFSQCEESIYSNKLKEKGFTKSDLILVFSHLILFTVNVTESISNKLDNSSDIVKVTPSSFPSCYSKIDVANALSKASSIRTETVLKIINFLTYSNGINKDIWAFPIVDKSENDICLLLGALLAPTPFRIVECWFRALGVDVESKGSEYERKIYEVLNDLISRNKILKNMIYVDKNIKLENDSQFEEIDIFIKIDKSILIIDLKSIVSIDSPVSSFRSKEKIKHGVDQVNRKIDFIKNNISYVSKKLKLDDLSECKFYPYVIVSNGSMNGCIIDGVSIISDDILFNYFLGGDIDLLVVNGVKYAKINLYTSFEEAKVNFIKYFSNPIDTRYNFDLYEYKLDVVNVENNILVNRLIRRSNTISEWVEKYKKYNTFKVSFCGDVSKIISDGKLIPL